MAKTLNIFNKISSLRERYYKASTGKEALIKLIAENEVAEQVYNSNAIENSTLTLEETEKILLQIDLDRFITEREIFEAKNLARVVSYIDKKAKEQELTLEVILSLHQLLLANIRDDVAGRFRKDGEDVCGGKHIAPDPKAVLDRLGKMLAEYNASSHENIIKRIALLHLTFEYIHPFVDGNGRIGRVINNYLLIREGFVPINIKFIDKNKYYEAFKEFDEKNATNVMEEIAAYIEYNPDVFRGKTLLLPCDDPEWSNFTKFFAQKFAELGLKKLISTSYAVDSKSYKSNYQPTLFETSDPQYDKNKTTKNGKIFTLSRDKSGDGKIDVNDLEWCYLKGDGDFCSDEIKKLRDEADIIITNPPFSLFRDFLAWIMEANKKFVIISNMNAITYKEVFPLIKNNRIWLGAGKNDGRNVWYQVPDNFENS